MPNDSKTNKKKVVDYLTAAKRAEDDTYHTQEIKNRIRPRKEIGRAKPLDPGFSRHLPWMPAGQEGPPKPVKRFKGKYAGPDKYKGVIPDHLKDKFKGKYFGKDSNKGSNPESTVGVTPSPKLTPHRALKKRYRLKQGPVSFKKWESKSS